MMIVYSNNMHEEYSSSSAIETNYSVAVTKPSEGLQISEEMLVFSLSRINNIIINHLT